MNDPPSGGFVALVERWIRAHRTTLPAEGDRASHPHAPLAGNPTSGSRARYASPSIISTLGDCIPSVLEAGHLPRNHLPPQPPNDCDSSPNPVSEIRVRPDRRSVVPVVWRSASHSATPRFARACCAPPTPLVTRPVASAPLGPRRMPSAVPGPFGGRVRGAPAAGANPNGGEQRAAVTSASVAAQTWGEVRWVESRATTRSEGASRERFLRGFRSVRPTRRQRGHGTTSGRGCSATWQRGSPGPPATTNSKHQGSRGPT